MAAWTSVTPTKKKAAGGPPMSDPVLWPASIELPPRGTPWNEVLEAVLEAVPGQVFAADPTKPVLKLSLLTEEAQQLLVRNGVKLKNDTHLAVFATLEDGWAHQVHLQGIPVTATDADIAKVMAPAFGKVVRLVRPHLPGTKVHGTTATAWALLPKDAKLPRTLLVHGATVSSLLTSDKTAGPLAPKSQKQAPPQPATAAVKKAATVPAPKPAKQATAQAPATQPPPHSPTAAPPKRTNPEGAATEPALQNATAAVTVPATSAETATAVAPADADVTPTAAPAVPTTTTTAAATAPATEATAATEPTPTAATPSTTTPTTSNPPTPATPETATATLPTTATPASQAAPLAAAAEAAKPPAACQTPHPAATVVTLTATPTAATATPPTVGATRTPDATTPSTAHRIVMRVTQLLTSPSRRRHTAPSSPSSPYATASDGEGSPTPPPPLPRRSERIRTLGSN